MIFLTLALNKQANFLLLALMVFTASSYAAANENHLNQLHQQAEQLQLWKHPEWLNLLHYEGNGNSPDDYVSQVVDQVFFLTDDGANDPRTELDATLTGIFDVTAKDDDNIQCRFCRPL